MLKIKSIDPMTASEWLKSGEAILIDVREPEEYQEGHIPGAHLIPINTITSKKLPPEAANKKIITHCKMGKRGSMACEILLNENPKADIYNIEGGIIAWENAGFKIEK